MKNLIKKITTLLLISLSFSSFAADKTTVLLSEAKGGTFTIDFLNENNITAMQFDIVLNNKANKSIIGSCETFLPKSHMGMCKVTGNKLRVVVFSSTNTVLDSGKIGEFKLNNYNQQIKIENVEFAKPDASVIKGEILVDRINDNEFLRNKSLK